MRVEYKTYKIIKLLFIKINWVFVRNSNEWVLYAIMQNLWIWPLLVQRLYNLKKKNICKYWKQFLGSYKTLPLIYKWL